MKTDAALSANSKAKLIALSVNNSEDLAFVRAAFGFDAEEKGWFREKNRLFYF